MAEGRAMPHSRWPFTSEAMIGYGISSRRYGTGSGFSRSLRLSLYHSTMVHWWVLHFRVKKKIDEAWRRAIIFFGNLETVKRQSVFLLWGLAEERKTRTNLRTFWTQHSAGVHLTNLRFLLMDVTSKKSRTQWNRVLLVQVTSLQLVKKFSVFYGTWTLITAFTRAHHLSQS
jgi:hypothetical protein